MTFDLSSILIYLVSNLLRGVITTSSGEESGSKIKEEFFFVVLFLERWSLFHESVETDVGFGRREKI